MMGVGLQQRSPRQSPAKSKMRSHTLTSAFAWRRLVYFALVLCAGGPRIACSQTPSPLQEWKYPGGTILEKLYEPNLQEWRVVLGAAVAGRPRDGGGGGFPGGPRPGVC